MVYLNNNTEQQTVYIPKNDGTGSSHKPTRDLEGVDVTITEDITVVHPSSGYYGMSAVTIDASEYGQSNYDSGFDDGYSDGYSSGTSDGEQSIIDTFTSTTITQNGQYGSSANPYSSVTVDVAQTGHTDQELQEAYDSGYTSGSTDGYNSGYTSGETHQKSLLVSTAITQNGTYTRENGYSAITVNIPQTGSTNSIISVTGNTWYVLDHKFETGEKIEITNATFDYSLANPARHQQLVGGGDGEWVRIGGNGDVFYTSYYGDSKITYNTVLDDDHILLTNGAFYINDMETPVRTFGPYQTGITEGNNMVVFANTASGSDSVCGQTASVGIITIYDENDNVIAKYIPELHNGDACFHNIISGNYITPSGTGTPTITNTDYSEGYIDGRQDVIDTFTSTTATTNGVYGSSAHPLSSITVDVPQTGGSGTTVIFPADYIHSTTLSGDTSNCRIDTGIYPTTATTFRVKGMCKGYFQGNAIVGYTDVDAGGDDKDYRLFWWHIYVMSFDINNSRENYSFTPTDGRIVDLTASNYNVYDNINETYIINGTPQTSIAVSNIPIYVDVASWWLKSLEIWEGATKVFDGVAAYDENGNIGLYDSVSKSLLTPTNSAISMTYEIVPGADLGALSVSANGTYSASTDNLDGYSAVTVNVPTGSTLPLSSITITANTAITETQFAYSAITVNVSGSSTVISLVDNIHTQYMDWDATKCIDTKITATTATTMRIGYVGAGIGSDRVIGYAPQDGVYDWADWRYFNGYSHTNTVDLNTSRKQGGSPTNQIGIEYDITLGNNYLYDNINESYLVSQSDVQSSLTPMSIRVDVGSQKVKFVEIKDNGVTVFNGQAAIDRDGNIGLYDSVSNELYYNSGLTMAYDGTPTSPDYQSGYTDGYASGYTDGYDSGYTSGSTDGYNSGYTEGYDSGTTDGFSSGYTSGTTDGYNSGYTDGYDSGTTDGFNSGYTSGVTDGENSIISTFSSMTATTNGVYGDTVHPLSSITVNVPQTGGTIDLNPAFIDRSITEIVVPTACTKVGRAAFSYCEEARTITIPDTVTFIDVDGFSHCHRVTGITFGNGIKIIGEQAFEHCGDLLAQGETINNGHIILPDSVEKIRDDAFYDIDNSVTAITFGSGTTNLGDDIIAGTNIQEIYSYATTAPQREVHIITSGGTHYEYYTFRGMINATGTVHYPSGSDYSSWQNDQYLSGWTFVGDL